jgi:RNA polymerase sigma-70 factor (ECF subfamily)
METFVLPDIAAGRSQAVEECMARYRGVVWRLARRMSPSEQDAEDAVQEIFVDVWKHAGRFDPAKGSETTFVATIARRRLIDRGRRRGRRPRIESIEEPAVIPAQVSGDRVAIADEAAVVARALADLRPEQRRVLEMTLLEGRTHQQVADATAMPLGTVKSHARRGLARVRSLLGVEEGQPDAASGSGRTTNTPGNADDGSTR